MTDHETNDNPPDMSAHSPGEIGLDDSGEGEFIAEEKKSISSGTIVLFGILLAGIAGTYFMYLRTGPQSASAATTESAAAHETINQFLSDGGKKVKLMAQLLQNTEKVVQEFLDYPGKKQVPLDKLQTNPFALWISKKQPGEDVSDSMNKRQREEQRVAVLKSVQELQLQSVLSSGTRKACMINNSMMEEGQEIDGFTIERIGAKSVIVRRSVWRFELKMQK